MGSIDRKIRTRDKQRADILSTAMDILKSGGTAALSLRKIAGHIEYSAPMIYTHFLSKEALLKTLCDLGYQQLNSAIQENSKEDCSPVVRLHLWFGAYWNFANSEKELYQLMVSFGSISNDVAGNFPEVKKLLASLMETISFLNGIAVVDQDSMQYKAFEFLALVHGLVSADFFWNIDPVTNAKMQAEMIRSFVHSLEAG